MPIYEYECESCNHRFELRQGFDAEPKEPCPLCQSSSRRKFHSPTVIYKGSGFYTTDYARKSPPSYDENGSNDESASTNTTEKETSPKED